MRTYEWLFLAILFTHSLSLMAQPTTGCTDCKPGHGGPTEAEKAEDRRQKALLNLKYLEQKILKAVNDNINKCKASLLTGVRDIEDVYGAISSEYDSKKKVVTQTDTTSSSCSSCPVIKPCPILTSVIEDDIKLFLKSPYLKIYLKENYPWIIKDSKSFVLNFNKLLIEIDLSEK